MLNGERLGRGEHLVQHAAVLRLEPAPLGRGETLVGQTKARDLLERLPHASELLCQTGPQRPKRRGSALLRPHGCQRIGQQPAPLGVAFGHPQSADQRQGFAPLEVMFLRRRAHRLLLVMRQSTQGMRQGHTDDAGVDLLGHLRAELLGQRQAREHPLPLLAAQRGDGRRAELLVVAQVPDHARFVHGRQRARRAVGQQQGRLRLCARAGPLYHHRHSLDPERTPALEPLEAVDDLEYPALRSHHP